MILGNDDMKSDECNWSLILFNISFVKIPRVDYRPS